MSLPILHYEKYGDVGIPILILHGLFGSAKNWVSIARALSGSYQIYALDARNHGKSFHHPEHSIKAMAEDLERFYDFKGIDEAVLIGHSMGGLTAMRFALYNPAKVLGLIVVDIAPKAYNINYDAEFKALNLDLKNFTSRREIDEALVTTIPNPEIRQFLQTNIERNEQGNYYWILNVKALENAPKRADPEIDPNLTFKKNTVFFRATQEKFITDNDIPLIKKYFPNATLIPFNKGNHWLHVTEKEKFLQETEKFLLTLQKN